MKEFKDYFGENLMETLNKGEEVIDSLDIKIGSEFLPILLQLACEYSFSKITSHYAASVVSALYYKERAEHFEKLLNDVCNEESKKCQAS